MSEKGLRLDKAHGFVTSACTELRAVPRRFSLEEFVGDRQLLMDATHSFVHVAAEAEVNFKFLGVVPYNCVLADIPEWAAIILRQYDEKEDESMHHRRSQFFASPTKEDSIRNSVIQCRDQGIVDLPLADAVTAMKTCKVAGAELEGVHR